MKISIFLQLLICSINTIQTYPQYLTVKTISIITKFIQLTYPNIWKTPFDTFLIWSKQTNNIYLQYYYTRVMYYLDEDIFHNAQNEFIECNTVRIIKDTIRSTCVNDIIYSLYIYIYLNIHL